MGSNLTDVAVTSPTTTRPTVGRIVNFVASDEATDIRAMLVTGVFESDGQIVVTGQVFRQGLQDPAFVQPIVEVSGVRYDANCGKSTWHWPARQ